MAASIAQTVLQVLKEGLSAWKVFIQTREKAYRRSMDRRKARAIDYAEKYILENKSPEPDARKLRTYAQRFFKYNN